MIGIAAVVLSVATSGSACPVLLGREMRGSAERPPLLAGAPGRERGPLVSWGFDAFGDDVQYEGGSEGGDCSQDRQGHTTGIVIKLPVDLEDGHQKLHQMGQA